MIDNKPFKLCFFKEQFEKKQLGTVKRIIFIRVIPNGWPDVFKNALLTKYGKSLKLPHICHKRT